LLDTLLLRVNCFQLSIDHQKTVCINISYFNRMIHDAANPEGPNVCPPKIHTRAALPSIHVKAAPPLSLSLSLSPSIKFQLNLAYQIERDCGDCPPIQTCSTAATIKTRSSLSSNQFCSCPDLNSVMISQPSKMTSSEARRNKRRSFRISESERKQKYCQSHLFV
jgi:hypothetical protein